MTGKLMFVPDDWVVVPREPTEEQIERGEQYTMAENIYTAMIGEAPSLPTPPVLRWEGNALKLFGATLARVYVEDTGGWNLDFPQGGHQWHDTRTEARRAAEKALGFPDELVVEVV